MASQCLFGFNEHLNAFCYVLWEVVASCPTQQKGWARGSGGGRTRPVYFLFCFAFCHFCHADLLFLRLRVVPAAAGPDELQVLF